MYQGLVSTLGLTKIAPGDVSLEQEMSGSVERGLGREARPHRGLARC